MNVAITGGAGFIGRHLARRLLSLGHEVTVLDSFLPVVHGDSRELDPDLRDSVRLVVGDVRDDRALGRTLDGSEVVVHLAAETATGQSMRNLTEYDSVNIGGTASLFQHLVRDPHRSVQRVLLASSRAVYGEGKYSCASDGDVFPPARAVDALEAGDFEPRCPICDGPATAVPTDEHSPANPGSFYGLTKWAQERMVEMFSPLLSVPAIIFRYHNVYGPGQSLTNPYTGTLSIFSALARAGQPIELFEDGRPSRDYVFIDDVADATARCVGVALEGVETLNVGSGRSTTIAEAAETLVGLGANRVPLVVSGAFRRGDVRHACADIGRARSLLGYEPRWELAEGLRELASWAEEQPPVLGQLAPAPSEGRAASAPTHRPKPL